VIEPTCPPHHKHGAACYSNHSCRCTSCTAANTARVARRRRERDPSMLAPEDHGKPSAYTNYGCRCVPCTQVHKAACKAYRESVKRG